MNQRYENPYPSDQLESQYPFSRYQYERLDEKNMLDRAKGFFNEMDKRRSIRMFSSEPVPQKLIELAVKTASTAPSGAHKQPWSCLLYTSPSPRD